MGIAFVIFGVIAAAIYNAVSDNGFDKKAGGILVGAFFIVGCILGEVLAPIVLLFFLFVLFAGWVFS